MQDGDDNIIAFVSRVFLFTSADNLEISFF